MNRYRVFLSALILIALGATSVIAFAEASRPTPGTLARSQQAEILPIERLDAFARPVSARERHLGTTAEIKQAVSLLTTNDPGVPTDWLPGQARAGDLRVPLVGLGMRDRSIFMFRTERGRVCYGLTGFSSGCLRALPGEVSLTAVAGEPDAYDVGEGPIVYGFARNDVLAVDVVVDGKTYSAKVGANSYFFQVSDNRVKAEAITQVIAHLHGGRTSTVDVVSPPTTDSLPHSTG